MSSTLRFPDAEKMTEFLCNHPLLNSENYQEKGITNDIAELAAKKFANSDRFEIAVKLGTVYIINDLKLRENGKFQFNHMDWVLITMATEKALLACARNFNN